MVTVLQCGYTNGAIDQIFDALDENWDGVLEPAELRLASPVFFSRPPQPAGFGDYSQ